jgi:hypothetical protein
MAMAVVGRAGGWKEKNFYAVKTEYRRGGREHLHVQIRIGEKLSQVPSFVKVDFPPSLPIPHPKCRSDFRSTHFNSFLRRKTIFDITCHVVHNVTRYSLSFLRIFDVAKMIIILAICLSFLLRLREEITSSSKSG